MAEYSDQLKAQALALLIAGQSFAAVARELGVPVGTLTSWRRRDAAGLDAPDASGASAKRERIGELLVEYLAENLTTLREQARFFRNETWLNKQSASEAAILHGVLADKSIRLLEALEPDAEDADAGAGDDLGTDGRAADGGVSQ